MSTNQLTCVIGRIATLIRITLPIVRARVAVFSTLAIRAFLLAVATPTAFSSSTLVIVVAIVAPLSTNAIFTTRLQKSAVIVVYAERSTCKVKPAGENESDFLDSHENEEPMNKLTRVI